MERGVSWLERMNANPANYWGGFALDVGVATALVAPGAASRDGALAIAAGLAAYTLYEYAFHRWLYHALPGPAYRLHVNHHRDPAVPLGAPFFYTMLVIAGTWALASLAVDRGIAAVFAGTVLGLYAVQSAVHHVIHGWPGSHRLRGRWVQRLRRHHMIHHRVERANFGIVTSVWDRVFGTVSDSCLRARTASRPGASPASAYRLRRSGRRAARRGSPSRARPAS
jgi:sterol desaturase/sphingolipid hydroxylase (fatty acid hydroxylase superfamily)